MLIFVHSSRQRFQHSFKRLVLNMALVKHRAGKCYFQRRSPSSLTASQATLKPPNMQAISGQKPETAAERFIMSASAVDVSQAEEGKGGDESQIHERHR